MKTLLACLLVVTVAWAAITQLGCETQSAEGNLLRIDPPTTAMRNGQTQEFRATGGFSYTWELSDPSLGFLSTKTGATVVYADRYVGATSKMQTLKVTSVVGSGDPTPNVDINGRTNNASSGFIDTTEAIIEHLPTPDAPVTSNTIVTVTVSPSTATLTPAVNKALFSASGGSSYVWTTVGHTTLGSLDQTTSSSVTFTYTQTNASGSVILRATSGSAFNEATITLQSN